MAGWPDPGIDGDTAAGDIRQLTKGVKADLIEWRSQIAGGSTSGLYAAERYQELAAYRTFMADAMATKGDAIGQAYVRRGWAGAGFDPAARWAELNTEIVAFLDWFQTNWPKKAASGEPAFRQFDPATKQLTDLSITFGPAARTQMLARLDAVIAALPGQ